MSVLSTLPAIFPPPPDWLEEEHLIALYVAVGIECVYAGLPPEERYQEQIGAFAMALSVIGEYLANGNDPAEHIAMIRAWSEEINLDESAIERLLARAKTETKPRGENE
jgi:hypothetical protein